MGCMDVLVMAGGKGTRLGLDIEKPLLEIKGKPMIDYVIETLLKSKVGTIYIAVSKNTRKTKHYIKEKYGSDGKRIKIIETSGKNYIDDLNECIKYFSGPFLVLSCDIPTIKPKTINNIINHYLSIKYDNIESLCVAIERKKYLGTPTIEINGCIPAGINVLSPKYGEQREEIYIIDELLINVNTQGDKELVESLISKGGCSENII